MNYNFSLSFDIKYINDRAVPNVLTCTSAQFFVLTEDCTPSLSISYLVIVLTEDCSPSLSISYLVIVLTEDCTPSL